MDITPLIRNDHKVIQSYKSGVFKISGDVHDHPIFVTSQEVAVWDVDVQSAEDLRSEHFDILLKRASEFDVVLLGCGKTMSFISQELLEAFKNAGLCVDVMNTGAACRTYNVLLAEGRRLACFMLPYR